MILYTMIEVSKDDEGLLIDALFYFYIKRKPIDSERARHLSNYQSFHKKIEPINREFSTCGECIKMRPEPFNPFILEGLSTDAYESLIKIIYYFVTESLIEPKRLESYVAQLTESKDIVALTKLINIPTGRYVLTGNRYIAPTNKIGPATKIDLPVYHVTYDMHAGHVFAYIIQFVHFFQKEDYIIGTTRDHYNSYRHVLEMYDILRPGKRIIFEPDTIYEMEFKEILRSFDHSVHGRKLFMTNGFEGVGAAYYDKFGVYPGSKTAQEFTVEKVRDLKETYFNDVHMPYVNRIADACRERHEGKETFDYVFLVKNMAPTPFNATPGRGFKLDHVRTYIEEKNFKIIDPEEMDFSYMAYLLLNAKYIITSWNTIMYINKFFFNRESKVIVLCHIGYNNEYHNIAFRKTIYYAYCLSIHYIYHMTPDSITPEGMDYMIELFGIK